MAAWVVPDSGILIASAFPEAMTYRATAILTEWKRNGMQLVAPVLLHYELIAVTRKFVYQNRVTVSDAQIAIHQMLAWDVELRFDQTLIQRAIALATELNQPTAYDAQYLAVAEAAGCEFWTVDERFYNSVHVALPWVKWLGHQTT